MLAQEPQDRDAELIRRAGDGDRDAFADVVALHGGAVFRFLKTIAGASAEDALQETFLAAWRSAPAFRGEATVRTWLFTIARNAANRQFRRHVGEPQDFESIEELGEKAGWGDDNPERLALRRESSSVVSAALSELSDGDREVLQLRDVECLSGDEAAEVLGLSHAAMKTRLHRARLRLAAKVRVIYG